MNERELAERLAALPELEPPSAIRDRWHTALAELPRPVRASGPAGRRGRIVRWRLPRTALAAVAAAVAVLVGVLSVGVLASTGIRPPPPAVPISPPSALSDRDPTRLGELDDARRLRACLVLRAGPHSSLLAARRISWRDAPAVQLVLSSSTVGRLRILVVTPDCGAVLADATRGR
jgi:hypothetical protein